MLQTGGLSDISMLFVKEMQIGDQSLKAALWRNRLQMDIQIV